MTAKILTQERLKELLHYDPETGVFTRRVRTSHLCRKDGVWGGVNKPSGYIMGWVDSIMCYGHRLAWLYVNGVNPNIIDHIDGIRVNNRITNLRDCQEVINRQNLKRALSTSKTGVLGVSRRGDRFIANISMNDKNIYLGLFDDVESAHAAYLNAKRQLHPGNTL